jgi:RNA polymerase sigma-70 factor, ECF subfamily
VKLGAEDARVSGGAEAIDELLKKVREGDKNSLGELFSVYRGQLRSMIELRLDPRLNGRVSGSDILQDTYIEALKRIDHFAQQPEMPFYLWLRLVAAQRLVDIHRQHLGAAMRDVHREVTLDNHCLPNASSFSMAAHLAAQVESPSHAAMRNETLVLLEQALQTMDPVDREVLALRHFEELSNDEVAQLLNLKKAAASNRYIRALQRLKEILEKMPGSPGAPSA